MGKFVDVKYTQWTRFHFEDDANLEAIISELNESDDINNVLCRESHKFNYTEELVDTAEYIDADENGAATIEVWQDEDIIWDNDGRKTK